MTDVPVKAIESFSATGGILGLIILLLVVFMVWYIHSSRKYHSEENKALASERKEWREALDRNTAGYNELTKALITKPCLRPESARVRD